jgi:ribosomal protein S27AE
MSKDSTQAFIEAFKDTSSQCVQCGDDNDLLVKFTAHKVCGKCARVNHKKAVR